MNEIYMDHEDNGATVVYTLAEQREYEKRGWKRRVPRPWEVKAEDAPARKKPGPRPKGAPEE